MRNRIDFWNIVAGILLILTIPRDFTTLVDCSGPDYIRESQKNFDPKRAEGKSAARSTSDQILGALESTLLAKMGMVERPRPKQRIPVPEHLTELYERMMTENQILRADDHRVSHYDFDSARSFFPEGMTSNESTNSSFLFKLDGFREEQLMQNAELWLSVKRRIRGKGVGGGWSGGESSQSSAGRFRVNIFEEVRAHSVLLDSQVVHCGNVARWLTFDLSGAVERWRHRANKSGKVAVQVVSGSSSPGCALNFNYQPLTADSPVLIVYTNDHEKDLEIDGERGGRRTRRSTSSGRRRHRRRKHRHRHRGKIRSRENLCARQSLYVDFDKVGWKDWIFAPPGYHAYYCSGNCPFPLASQMNTTNHAVIQTLIHSVNPGVAPKACCVPTDLSPISLLYLDEFEKVVLKNYHDMVVEGCGCR